MEIEIITLEGCTCPSYACPLDAGMDVRARIDEELILKPLERRLIPVGFKVSLPEEIEMQVRPKSGLAIKHGISVLNTPGTVDPGYKDEVGVILVNLSNKEFNILPGMRIAQVVFSKFEKVNWSNVSKFSSDEDRGGGFGSTGIK